MVSQSSNNLGQMSEGKYSSELNVKGLGTGPEVSDSGPDHSESHKKHLHNKKPINGNNSTTAKENDDQSSAGSNISDDEAPIIPGVRRKAS